MTKSIETAAEVSAPVDVLAVLDYASEITGQHGWNTSANALIEAHAAVAELLDRAESVASTLESEALVQHGFIDIRDWFALVAEVRNLRAALARCGGAK